MVEVIEVDHGSNFAIRYSGIRRKPNPHLNETQDEICELKNP
jgi:hypothetical protein